MKTLRLNRNNLNKVSALNTKLQKPSNDAGFDLPAQGDLNKLALEDVLDISRLKEIMYEMNQATGLLTALLDLSGNVLIGYGWQEICTRFHRIHPDTRKHCWESDLFLIDQAVAGLPQAHKCANGLWDLSLPVIVGEKRVGTLFFGQFAYEDELIDLRRYQKQAQRYGFQEDEYMAALEKVPRFSREKIKHIMKFYDLLIQNITSLEYSNLQLTRNLEQQQILKHQLLESIQKVEKANEVKTQFLANMSHELRTPLNGLMGMLQLLQSTNLSEEQEEYIQIAFGSSQSLTRVVEDILNYTNLEKRTQKIIEEPFQLEGLLQDVLELHKSAAVHKGLFLSVYNEKNLPKQVIGDRFKLKQILGNLVGNAVKFTESGAVQLSVKQADEGMGVGRMKICFQVKDTGIGISPEKMDYIFQRFSQADESHTRQYGGLGLGLAVAKEQAAMLGGSLAAQSTPGQGSVFTLTCDVGVRQEPKPAADPVEAANVDYPQGGFSDIQVLVVDDDYSSRLMAQLLLKKMGCEVDTAINGQLAMEKVLAKNYHLVFMDCQMPVMDGYEAVRSIREIESKNGRHTTIIAMTAKVLPGDREKCMEVGMDGFLAKPIEVDRLKAEVKRFTS